MKILHLLNHLRNTGNGIVNSVVDLAVAQAALDHHVTIASSGGDYEPLVQRHGVAVFPLRQREPARAPGAVLALHRWRRAHRPDIVHAHMMSGALLAKATSWFHAGTLVTTVHNSWQWHSFLMRVGDRMIATTQQEGDLLRQRVRRPACVHTVTCGMLASPRRETQAPIDELKFARPSLLTIAGLYERTGIFELLDAFQNAIGRGAPGNLYYAGDGPERGRLEAEIGARGLGDRVACLGFRPDVSCLLAQTDVFILASRAEPFGLVLAEAREAGCAVMATEVGGMPSVLDNGEAGRLIPPGDPGALAEAVHDILTDASQRRRLAAKARVGLERFSTKRMAEETLAVYEAALGSA